MLIIGERLIRLGWSDGCRKSAPCRALDFGGCKRPPGTGSLHPVAKAATSSFDLKRGAFQNGIDCPASFMGFPNLALPSIFSLPPSGTSSVHAILGAVVPATSRPLYHVVDALRRGGCQPINIARCRACLSSPAGANFRSVALDF